MIYTKRKVPIIGLPYEIGKSEARGGNKKGINSLTHQGNTKLVYNQIDGLIRVPEKALEKSTVAEPLPEVAPKTHKKTTVKRKIDE